MKICDVVDCTNAVKAKGLCNKHYLRKWQHGDVNVVHLDMSRRLNPGSSLEDRFWSLVEKTDSCWVWLGSKSRGYGKINIGGKSEWAHRVAYRLTHGDVIRGLVVMHSCDNPPCVNPAHLVAGTQDENMADARSKGRGRIGRNTGEFAYQTKLTWAQVQEIRESSDLLKNLAAKYGVSTGTISSVKRGKSWKTPGEKRVDNAC
jgi:hypothetical protein